MRNAYVLVKVDSEGHSWLCQGWEYDPRKVNELSEKHIPLNEVGQNHTNIYLVLDRSGSMETIRDATIAGLNTFIEGQKEAVGMTASLTVVQFDDVIETVFANRDIKEVAPFNRDTFVPRNATALYDAIAYTLDIAEMKALSGGNGKNLVVIVTDGKENASRRFTQQQIFSRITARKTNGWDFVYIGANQDAYLVGSSLGISRDFSRNYSATVAGTNDMFQGLTTNTVKARKAYAGGQNVKSFWGEQEESKK